METIFHINEKLQIKISGDTHTTVVPVIFFAQYPNTLGITITLPAVILYYSTIRGTNRQMLNSKRYNEHPRHFYRGVPPGMSVETGGLLPALIWPKRGRTAEGGYMYMYHFNIYM